MTVRTAQASRGQLMLISVASALLFLIVWQAVTMTGMVSSLVLPSPVQVVQRAADLVTSPYEGETLVGHAWASLLIVTTAWLAAIVIGWPLGVWIGWSAGASRVIGGIIEVVRPIPPVAWIPLALIWFGLAPTGKVFVVWLAAVIPCIINAQEAVRRVDPLTVSAGRVLGASPLTILRTIVVPAALPFMLTGARISLGSAWMTLVAAELLASVSGLGYMMQAGRRNQLADVVVVGMLAVGLLGAATGLFLRWLEKRALPWAVEAR
ncbi:ABC transporter permease [Microbacterium alcoholitolerans]|uniref:ABC transporter permease n=1 Tax=unclassified Microbacterium TaxID=2609290 RepID=UPI003D1680D5